jgi:hypothetical protein
MPVAIKRSVVLSAAHRPRRDHAMDFEAGGEEDGTLRLGRTVEQRSNDACRRRCAK